MSAKRILCLIFAVLMIVSCFVGCGNRKTINDKVFETFEDFEGATLGAVTGSDLDMQTMKLFPDNTINRYDTITDLVLGLESGKIDGFLLDEAYASAIAWEREGYKTIASDKTVPTQFAYVVSENEFGRKLKGELNEFIAEMKANGEIDRLAKKWFSGKRPTEFADISSLTGENGTIDLALSDTDLPMCYQNDTVLTGFDAEFIIAFAKKYGYDFTLSTVDFDAMLTGVKTEKYHLAIGGITITEERKEKHTFTDCYFESPVYMIARDNATEGESKLSDLTGQRIGVMTGSIQAVMMPELVPDAEYMEFNSMSDLIAALNSNKIDAFGCDESLYTSMLWEGQKVDRIDEPLDQSNYGLIFRKGENLELQKEVNDFIAKSREDGSLEALEAKWFGEKEPTEFASYDELNGENGTITVAITSTSMPFVYLKENRFVGFDVEFIIAFAKEYGYDIRFEDTAFAAILSGVQSGKYDVGISGITITDERKESMDFSDIYHVEDLAVIIRGEQGENNIVQFNNATLGVVTGSLYGGYSREQFPDATIKEFNNFADVLMALKSGKVDGIMLDEPNFNSVARTDKNLSKTNVPAYSVEIGFGFQKNEDGNALQAQMNAFLEKLKAQGEIDTMIGKWYGETEPEENIPLEELTTGRVLNVSIDTTRKPFVYLYENQPVGFEIEVLYRFCKEYGYQVKLSDVSFASGLAGLASEKYDLVCGGLYMTPERKESVNFSNPYMNAAVVMASCERSGFDNFMLSLRESFEKTFVREQRWKLIVEGIYITMLISLFSVLGGTLLGFALYMAARSKYKWLSKLTKGVAKIYSTIIAGTPTLVVLMILFYIVFTSPDMSGVLVAIVGFILTFGSFVYDNLDLTVASVDNGQMEAAYALGYSRNRTFFRIILPQAMKLFIPAYIGEIVNLVKSTSVVGYIAVNDLTKMGDIIRGNTYEAFFPLIAVAVIYFAITWIIARLLGVLKRKTEPKLRKDKNILKGVVR